MSRTKAEWEATSRMIAQLQKAGITYEDAWTLRKISMTLQRWFEGECGNSDTQGSWCIVRGTRRKVPLDTSVPLEIAIRRSGYEFTHDDDGTPWIEYHPHQGAPQPRYTPIPDREKGARKRLAKILAKYPDLGNYIQGDPRAGCALYVLRPGDVPEGEDVYYSRGVAVHQ